MTHDEFLSVAAGYLDSYQASIAVREHISNIDFVPIIGPSGVGKTTVIKRLGLPTVLSDMTRERRPDEIDGEDAFFRTDYDRMMQELEDGEFAQFAMGPDGEFYATRSSAYPPEGFAVMPFVANALPSVRKLGFRSITPICLVAPTPDEWAKRYETKQHPPERHIKRLAEARQSLQLCLQDPEIFFVINGDLTTACQEIQHILASHVSDASQRDKARSAALAMLEQLG